MVRRFFFSSAFMLMLSWTAAAKAPPVIHTAEQVLSQFTEARQNLNSFIVKADGKSTYTYTGFKGTGVGYKKYEWRFDGKRCKNITSYWGDISIKLRDVKEEDADYHSGLWDGQNVYDYNYGKNPFSGKYIGGLTIYSSNYGKGRSNTFQRMTIRTPMGQIMGYHQGDDERIGELFMKPSVKLRLRPKKSNVRGVDCYVLEADVPGKGKYTLWIDPVHEFHIARSRVLRTTGDVMTDYPLLQGQIRKEVYEVLEFQKVGDAWFPKICKIKRTNHTVDFHSSSEREISISSIILEPDHGALQSFKPNDIPNGTVVRRNELPPDRIFIWQDGKPVRQN